MTVQASVQVPVDPATAFGVFTDGLGGWWRDYYSAPDVIGIRLESGAGGRLLELETAGEGFEVGRVTVWEPGRRLALDWRQPDWAADEATEVEVTFVPSEDGTRVSLVHRGWEEVSSDPAAEEGYDEGWDDLLGMYAEAVRRG